MDRRIVIIGSGFAGLQSAFAAQSLLSHNSHHQEKNTSKIEIVIISPEPRLVIRPRLYEANPKSLSAPLDKILSDTGIRYIQGHVTNIHTQERTLDIRGAKDQLSAMSYDRLILAAGSHLNLPNIPGLKEHAFNVDQFEGAVALDAHLHDLKHQPYTKARNSVVICGGGFTGIEIAAELPRRLASILGQDADIHVTIVERESELGPELGPGPRPVILRTMKELNIDLKLGNAVSEVSSNGIITSNGEHIDANTVIWTGGMIASTLTSQIPGAKDKLGRLIVDRDLQVPSAKEVFVTGDVAHVSTDDKGHTTLMSCQHALTLGRYSGYNAAADILNLPLRQYHQEIYGTCLALGPFGAVVTDGWDRKVATSGKMAGLAKQFINEVLIYPPRDTKEAFRVSDPDFQIPSADDGVVALLKNRDRGTFLLYIWRFIVLKLFGTSA